MFKNVASQKLIVFAFDSTTNSPKTGDAANITAYVSKDYGSVTVLGDTSATEMDATNAKGYYLFDLTQGETNGDTLLFSAKSSTANIVVIGAPATVFTYPATGILAPTVSGRTLDVASTGEAGLDISNIIAIPAGSIPALGIAESGTAQAGSTGTTLVGRAAMSLADSIAKGGTLHIYAGTGAGQSRFTTAFVGATDTWTVDPAWTTTPDNTSQYIYFAGAQAPTTLPMATNVTQILGTAVSTPATAGILDVNVKNIDNDAASASGTVTFPNATLASTTNITAASGVRMSSAGVDDILRTALTEAYAADGAAGTLSQILFGIQAFLQERSVSGTTTTVKKLDGTTTAMTFTISDATAPVSITRAT